MGIKDWFGRGPKDYNEQLVQAAEAEHQAAARHKTHAHEDATPVVDSQSSEALVAAVLERVRAGNKIEAIKLYKDSTGQGLKESKDAVEALAAGHAAPTVAAPAQRGTDAEVAALLGDNKKIEAIKLYREIHHVGLKEAKDAVDAMERQP